MQELQAMNVQMRVLTEDNIDQIASMSFSTTTLKLGGAANLIRENKATVGAKVPTVPVSPKADNRPALRPDGESEEPGNVAESLGWQFVNFEANGGEIYQSLLRDERGAPTQMWSVQQHGGKYPTEHPDGWNAQMLYYNDGVPIKAEAVVDMLKRMPYANNFALAVQDIRDEQTLSEANRSESEAIDLPNIAMSPEYEPMSPVLMQGGAQQSQPQSQQQQMQPMMMQQQQMQPMMSQPMVMQQPMMQQPMVMMPQQMMMSQPMMMMPQHMMMQPQQPQQLMTTTTGSNAGELIKEQLNNGNGNGNGNSNSNSSINSSRSILDMEPENPESEKPQDDSKGEGKRVIKLG
jgi:hypothetical protein